MDKDDQNESEYGFFYLPNLEKVVDKLEFYVVLCMSKDESREIEFHQKRQAYDLLTFQIVALVHRFQYQKVTMWSPKKIAADVSTLLCYDHGYEKAIDNAFITENQLTSLASNHKGSVPYCDEIEDKYPGFISTMYRYAENVLSNQASFEQLAALMNEKSETEEGFPILALKKFTIWKWFRNKEGKECFPMEKPFLTEDQKK
eukprot:13068309-Ditylum_brightwellii.AAC.1